MTFLKRRVKTCSTISCVILMFCAFLPNQAHAKSTHQADSNFSMVVCLPDNRGQAFPYKGTDTESSLISKCSSGTFYWGYTVSGSSTGTATWSIIQLPPPAVCQIQVFVPNNHATTYNAQYYVLDGKNYIANDANVNQENLDGWYYLFGDPTLFFLINNNAVVTLNDHDPHGDVNLQIAASAVRFDCVALSSSSEERFYHIYGH